jgi:aminodeoxyfutalosine deaminase
MLEAGVLCSISTDDPAMFDTDLSRDYEVAAQLGCSPEEAFRAGVVGALCDAETRTRLRMVQSSFPWADHPDLPNAN